MLRIAIFLLRLTLGLNFLYLGFSTLFNRSLGRELGNRSLTSFYQWFSSTAAGTTTGQLQTFFQWAFLIVGACLILGLMIRFVSIVAIALTLAGFLPTLNLASLAASQFINDEIIVIACLLVLIAANAGTYLGVDSFMHIHFTPKHKGSEA
ncbi:MAG: TQO small subunit DoxD [Minisyncoccia bacterium]|jgi:uncharacterized membrane protein YphA (DoxX/SURF4 family)